MKRILDCSASDFERLDRGALCTAIRKAEGRTIITETIGAIAPVLLNVSNAELAAAMGADLIVLNMFDVLNPKVFGLPPCQPNETVRTIRRLTGCVVGVNLEPVEQRKNIDTGDIWALTPGRLATVENAQCALEMGVQFIVLTGNPGNGVDNKGIAAALSAIRTEIGDSMMLVTGKMHASGITKESGHAIMTAEDIGLFSDAGADMILLPAPGTVPGITVESARKLVDLAHERDMLAMTAIGTSQEGADVATIRQLALYSKMTGADAHHLGDAGCCGVALPENIFTYSVAIRGVRHTYTRMARSIVR